jgi:hypothetical protein
MLAADILSTVEVEAEAEGAGAVGRLVVQFAGEARPREPLATDFVALGRILARRTSLTQFTIPPSGEAPQTAPPRGP